jgi:AcrR family transcriptional regulator
MSDRAARTRDRLQAVALDLVTRQGFEATTAAEIAAAAGVTEMTFFRHFATKEDVILDDPYDPVLADAVRAQPLELAPVERVRRAVLETWAALPQPADEATQTRIALTVREPRLMARAWQNNRRTEQLAAEALAEGGVDRIEADAAAGAVFGALMAGLLSVSPDHSDTTPGERIAVALKVLDFDGANR